MYLESLSLRDWRNHPATDLVLGPGVHVLVGGNAQGKTNVLEAIAYLATQHSHRAPSPAPLVRMGAEAAVIRSVVRRGAQERRVTLDMEVRARGRRRIRVNGQAPSRSADALGTIRVVSFAPEDLALVRGEPGDRRRFLDELLAQRRPAYAAARAEFERTVRQRNHLLRQARGSQRTPAALEDWTAALIQHGATLLAARIAAVHALAAPLTEAYASLLPAGAPSAALPTLIYDASTGAQVPADPTAGVPDPAGLAAALQEALHSRFSEERERGLTLVGPHRDDVVLRIGQLPARGYASHGECWSLALALRVASHRVLTDFGEHGDEPLVLLDDVFAELDEGRRARLAARCADFGQVLVTAAVERDVPLPGRTYEVSSGSVKVRGDARS